MKAEEAARRLRGEWVIRFSYSERIEHVLLMVSFTTLVLTGLPQKFHSAPWASWIVLAFGGIDTVRFVHRGFALIFTVEALYHLGYVVRGLWSGRLAPSMVPCLKDFHDSWRMLQYCLGLTQEQPRFSRFSYREKFEYWGVVLGAAIMVVTGGILWLPALATQMLPGEIVPAAKEAHGGEALLAFLVIVVWHLYGVHLSPLRFPGDLTIFTGRISRKRMVEEHPLEYAELLKFTDAAAPVALDEVATGGRTPSGSTGE